MSLEPDRWCIPGDWPRHRLRAYGRAASVPAGSEYRRLLNFLSKSAARSERDLLDSLPVPLFAQVPTIVNRRIREKADAAMFSRTRDGISSVAPVLASAPRESSAPQPLPSVSQTTFNQEHIPAVPANVPLELSISMHSSSGFEKEREQEEDAQFISHLALLLNEWFDKESSVESVIEDEDNETPEAETSFEKRRKRTQELLKNSGKAVSEEKSEEPGRLLNRLSGAAHGAPIEPVRSRTKTAESNKNALTRIIAPLGDGKRKETFRDGSFLIKDAVGRVNEVRAHDGSVVSFTYDERGHLKSFVRSDVNGKIQTTGLKDKHGAIVRDDHGAVRAQGDSMSCDSNGCVSIRKFDGQFWSLDIVRGIYIERRILEDADGSWNCLTALLTGDGFRMATRFQKLQEDRRESYRKYGDWLGSEEASKVRFYGRDGSMIQFDNDENLAALRPDRIWSPGSRPIEREWVGRRQAGTAWESVHQYISQYLSAL